MLVNKTNNSLDIEHDNKNRNIDIILNSFFITYTFLFSYCNLYTILKLNNYHYI